MAEAKPKKVSEFNDGRKRPTYRWRTPSSTGSNRAGAQSISIPRQAKFIDTDIGDGNRIHEFYIENTEKPKDGQGALANQVNDLVALFENFDSLSSVPGIKIHAIDLPGFGLSSRPSFPKFNCESKEDIYQIEDWFIDSLEKWRKERGIDRFVLVGHSFGGYLSCAYARKYNKLISDGTAAQRRIIDKLVLLSPVGVERSKYSLLKSVDIPSEQISSAERSTENKQEPTVPLQREFSADQEDIVEGKEPETLNHPGSATEAQENLGSDTFTWLWRHHVSPFSIVRKAGPLKSRWISAWTGHRFSHIYQQNPERYQHIHDYFYKIFNGAGSGEYAITRILDRGALARLPLLDRCPEKFAEMKLPTLWLYGDKDWMNEVAGEEMTKEINRVAESKGQKPLAEFGMLSNAGHHLYLDNPKDFSNTLFKFLRK
ncbi:hypothetical protein CXQ85_003342 [Candidozyma haemuli]|uniref:AB hydrolase-1 domain-containing protein n=1 Tax=Candidozyma haemuli TaxID=45357 RepID=A0A2V1APP1_9ASCO|nr:hypothetical protein CXQ85_003342 [[Candida] haemuloni]PVH19496.1 hypothetical protein CXQ85_003342 [[Candida] haemuloni]